jgi:hypothetical protein
MRDVLHIAVMERNAEFQYLQEKISLWHLIINISE